MATHFHQTPNLYTSHVQLKVANLARSIEFYTTIIGFQLLEQKGNTAYLTVDGKTSLVSLTEVPHAVSQQGFTGLYHVAFLLPTRKDLGNIIQHFIQTNTRLGTADHDVSEALYLSDPDGNGIEIYIDRPEQAWTWNRKGHVHMVTDPLNVQAILAEADGTWSGLPQGTVIGHMHLSVSDLAQTAAFYTAILNFNIVCEYGGQALFVSTGNYHHHIGFNTWHSAGRPALPEHAVGLQSFTIVLKDKTYAQAVKEALQAAGATVERYEKAPAYGGQQLFSTIDPNGIRLVFTVDGE